MVVRVSHPMKSRDIQNNTEKLAFNRRQAADLLSLSPVTIDRLVSRGLLRPSRACRRPIFSADELKRFLRETAESVEL